MIFPDLQIFMRDYGVIEQGMFRGLRLFVIIKQLFVYRIRFSGHKFFLSRQGRVLS